MALNDMFQQTGVKADVPLWTMVKSELQSMIFSLQADIQKCKSVCAFVEDTWEVERLKGETLKMENERLLLWLDDPKCASNCLGVDLEESLLRGRGADHYDDMCSKMVKMQDQTQKLIEDLCQGLKEEDVAKDLPWIISLSNAMPQPVEPDHVTSPAEISVPYPNFARGSDEMRMDPMPARQFMAKLEPAPNFFMSDDELANF